MKINKKMINNYPVYIYNTKMYSSIHLVFMFELPFTRKDIFICDLLEEYMIYANEKYPTREAIGDKRMELYSMDCGVSNFIRGEKQFVRVSFGFYDPELVQNDYIKDALKFASDIVFRPNFKDGHLDKKALARVKQDLINSMGEDLMSTGGKSNRSFIKMMFPDTYRTRDMIESKEEYIELLDSITDEEIIKMHKNLIDNSMIGAVLMGNIHPEYYDFIGEAFKFKTCKKIDRRFKDKLKISSKTPFETVVEDSDVKDSMVRVVYECPAKNLKKKLVYSVISRMLSGSGMIIHKVLRDEMNIVYSAGSDYNMRQDYMVLGAKLDKANVDKALEGFEIALKRLEDKNLIKALLSKIKEEDALFLYCFDENKYNNYDELFDRAFKLTSTDRKKIKVTTTIEEDDVMEALKEMKKVKIHFYKGTRE